MLLPSFDVLLMIAVYWAWFDDFVIKVFVLHINGFNVFI